MHGFSWSQRLPSMHIVLLNLKFVNFHLRVLINSSTFTNPHTPAVIKQGKIPYKITGHKDSAKKHPSLSYCKKKKSRRRFSSKIQAEGFLIFCAERRYPPADSKASHFNRQSSAASSNSILSTTLRAPAWEAQPCWYRRKQGYKRS